MTTTPTRPPSPVEQSLRDIVGILTQANVAIPVVLGTVTAVVGIVRALRGDTRPLAAVVAELEQQLAVNDARGRAEIERLRAQL